MDTHNILEDIVRDLKKLANGLLIPQGPLDKIILVCNRFIALKDVVSLSKVVDELQLSFEDLEAYVLKMKKLLAGLCKYNK